MPTRAWVAHDFGAEKFYSARLPRTRTRTRSRTRTWREVVGLGAELAASPDVYGADFVVRHVLAESGIEPLVTGLPDTVEVARRRDILTVINHGDGPVSVELPGNDFLTGEAGAL